MYGCGFTDRGGAVGSEVSSDVCMGEIQAVAVGQSDVCMGEGSQIQGGLSGVSSEALSHVCMGEGRRSRGWLSGRVSSV